MLDQTQIAELKELIDAYHLYFGVRFAGSDILSERDLELFSVLGLDISSIIDKPSYLETVFKLGTLSMELKAKDINKLSFASLSEKIATNQVPLTKTEKKAIRAVKKRGLKDIRGLGNRIGDNIEDIVVEADPALREVMENIIARELDDTVSRRESIQSMISGIGHKTRDWSRDLGRISETMTHNAFDLGRAYGIMEDNKGEDPLVYKDVYPGACKHCIRLYLTAGIGSRPKVFKLSTLLSNGTNIGLKAAELKPVVGSTHPFCRCTLQYVPKGYEWNEETQRFDKPKEFKRKVDRKSKIKVSINEKKFEV